MAALLHDFRMWKENDKFVVKVCNFYACLLKMKILRAGFLFYQTVSRKRALRDVIFKQLARPIIWTQIRRSFPCSYRAHTRLHFWNTAALGKKYICIRVRQKKYISSQLKNMQLTKMMLAAAARSMSSASKDCRPWNTCLLLLCGHNWCSDFQLKEMQDVLAEQHNAVHFPSRQHNKIV